MADDSPNKANIQEMLDNLAKQKQGGTPSASSRQTSASAPSNLPTNAPAPQVPQQPKPQPQPVKHPQKTTTPPPAPVTKAPAPQVPRPAPPTPAQPQPVTKAPAPQDAGEKITNEIRTMSADVEKLKTGQAPAPVSSQPGSAPQKVTKPPTADKTNQNATVPGVVIPEKSSGGMAKKFIYVAVGLIILIVVVVAGLSFFGDREPAATPTPIPAPAPTISLSPAPTTKDLSFYFGQLTKILVFTDTMNRQDIQNLLGDDAPVAKTADNVEFQGSAGFPSVLSEASSDVLGIEGATLIYGQTEFFEEDGQPFQGPIGDIDIALIYIAEIVDATAANQHMTEWENDFIEDANLFNIDPRLALVEDFSDASYRQIPVRYKNFPYADKSLDWSIVPASNGKNYLVITNSRQSIFFAIDQLLK